MNYKVVPFVAILNNKKNDVPVSYQLQELITTHTNAGWTYIRLESVPTINNNSGCFGIGATSTQSFNHMIVFKKD